MERQRPSEQQRLREVRAELASLTGGGPISRTFREVQDHVASFQEERPLMREYNTPVRMAEWMQGETHELLAEMHWGEQEPSQEEIDKVRMELADVVIFSLNIGHMLGIDVEQAVLEKVARNNERFPRELFQDPSQDFEQVYHQRKIELGEREDKPRSPVPTPGLIRERNEWIARQAYGVKP